MHYPAQATAIKAIVRGISPIGEELTWNIAQKLFNKATERVFESKKYSEAKKEELRNILAASFTEVVQEELEEFTEHNFDAFMDTADSLNARDLAEIAEKLVAAEGLVAENDWDQATVGGFVEVLTIDLENGLRWLKRLP
jgi:hypothetical protein